MMFFNIIKIFLIQHYRFFLKSLQKYRKGEKKILVFSTVVVNSM